MRVLRASELAMICTILHVSSYEHTALVGRPVRTSPKRVTSTHELLHAVDVSTHIEMTMCTAGEMIRMFECGVYWHRVTPALFSEHSFVGRSFFSRLVHVKPRWLVRLGSSAWPRTRTVFAEHGRHSLTGNDWAPFQDCLGWSWCDR